MSIDLPEVVPVFPLPNVVFFPGTTLSLSVFEPRYLEMIQDLRASHRWMAVTLLKPGYEEDYFGSPDWYPIAGVGRLTRIEDRPENTLHIEIQGLHRVRLEEVENDRSYRTARVRILDEDPAWLSGDRAYATLNDLVRAAAKLNLLEETEFPSGLPGDPEGRGKLLNRVAGKVVAELFERQSFLEASGYSERAALVLDQCRFMINALTALARVPRPEHPEHN